ncbi:MAG: hypothetical protein ACREC0_14250 [Methylocella sp.]
MNGGVYPKAEGSKGPRLYAWARLRLFRLQAAPFDHRLLIRRSIADPAAMAFYVTFGPHATDLKELAAAAGLRWTIYVHSREMFSIGERRGAVLLRGAVVLARRGWHGWHRRMTLSILALADLAGLRGRG